MNWKKIQQAWESGDKQIAVRLLESMICEMRLRQLSLLNFNGGEIYGEEKEKKMWGYGELINDDEYKVKIG